MEKQKNTGVDLGLNVIQAHYDNYAACAKKFTPDLEIMSFGDYRKEYIKVRKNRGFVRAYCK